MQTRRQVIVQAIKTLPLLAIGVPALSWAGLGPRRLSFYHTHTHESLSVMYVRDGRYDVQGMQRVEHFLRDFRTGETHAIDPVLLDFLYDTQMKVGGGVFEVISGFRSPSTNVSLSGAGRSLHLCGQAIDVRLQGVKTSSLRNVARAMQRGGTGYYQISDFVHLDTGRVRNW